MKLINTDGMALIGPGSEWLWTALSGLVLAITFVAIYRQLRVQASANAVELATRFSREWTSEAMSRNKLAVLVALRDHSDPADIPVAAGSDIGDMWERVAYLIQAGHIDLRLCHEHFGEWIRLWWRLLRPNTVFERERQQAPGIYDKFEWLAARMDELAAKDGGGAPVDEAALARLIPLGIDVALERIRSYQELRAVIVRPLSTAPQADFSQLSTPEAIAAS